MTAADARPFRIQGVDGPIEVPPKHFYFNTKARCREMMKRPISGYARRTYACLELATMGWQQELAVIREADGNIRPMYPRDIVSQTGLSKQNVRRALVELEENGLAERRDTDGRIELYSWATPRPVKKETGSRARLPLPDWFPDSWAPLRATIKRLKAEVSIDEVVARDYLEEGAAVARLAQETEMVVSAFIKKLRAQPPKPCAQTTVYKEERTKELQITEEPSSSSPVQDATTTTSPVPEPDPLPPVAAVEPEPPKTLPVEETTKNPDIEMIAGQLGVDDDAAKQLLRDTRNSRRDVTAQEIVRAAFWKVKQLTGNGRNTQIRNMIGLLIRAVPKMAASAQWLDIREELRREGVAQLRE
jgi:DNA-binding transcriptional ArsR family regulator